MGDDEAQTTAAPTELGAAIDQTEAHTAWSLVDDEPDPPRLTPGRITALAVVGSLTLVAAAAGVTLWQMRTPASVVVAPPTPIITTVIVQPPSQRPSTPLQRPPEARTVEPPVPVTHADPRDSQFLEHVRALGWTIDDPALLAVRAHQVCAQLQRGVPPDAVVRMVLAETGPSPWSQHDITTANQLVYSVVDVYPNCRRR